MTSMYNDNNLRTIADISGFLKNLLVVDITITGTPAERADWIYERLLRFKYMTLSKKDKGILLKYLKITMDLSEKQIDRYIKSFKR
jgi:hypothetical protein